MGLVNLDIYTAPNGVSLANTYVKLGVDTVHFAAHPDGTYSATTTMIIYKDAQACAEGCQPLESRNVRYGVPDPSAVYQLLYGSAVRSEGWANTQQVSSSDVAAVEPPGNAAPVAPDAATVEPSGNAAPVAPNATAVEPT